MATIDGCQEISVITHFVSYDKVGFPVPVRNMVKITSGLGKMTDAMQRWIWAF
jgi:hypothetical protein